MAIDIKKLDQLFHFAVKNQYSSFYRDLYDRSDVSIPADINSISDWESLPFLNKADLAVVPLTERIFTPLNMVDSVRSSSGTSGQELLITPRNHIMDYRSSKNFRDMKMNGILSVHSPQHDMERTFRSLWGDIPIIFGDMMSPELAVAMAAKAKVDSIVGFVFMLNILLPYLKKYDYTEKIKYIELMGERMSNQQFEHYQKIFPNAKIHTSYGASEHQGGVMMSFHNEDPGRRFVMSQWPDYHLELVDPVSKKILSNVNETGELVVTTLWTKDNVFPLLRYCTGDLVTRVYSVDEGCDYGYLIHGRIDGDHKKILGGEISAARLEQVLSTYDDKLDFEACIDMKKVVDVFKHQLELRVVSSNALDTDDLGRFVSDKLQVSPRYSYGDNVERGLYLPLICKQVEALSPQSGKRQRLFTNY